MRRFNLQHCGQARLAHTLRTAVAVLLLFAIAVPGLAGAVQITILHDTHFHGNFGNEDLSLAHYAALVNRIRSQKPNTLFVGVGDDLASSLHSLLFRGEHMVEALNAAGLDFNTYGNHEFDYEADNVLEQVARSKFTWVTANVIDRRTGDVFGAEHGVRRYAVVDVGGVRVGITGIAPADTPALSKIGDDVIILDPAEALAALVPEIRKEASVVVVLSHEAWTETERIAAIVPGVDVYVGDHSATMIPQPKVIGGAIVSRVGAELDYLGELTLTVEGGAITGWEFQLHDVRALVESGELYPDVRVQRVIDRYLRLAEASLGQEVGVTRTPLDGRRETVRTRESALTNFLADVLRDWAGADVAIVNGGAFRSERVHGPGPLTRADIVSILPFVNYATTLRLKGQTIVDALELGVSSVESEHGRFLHVSGLSYTFDLSKPPGERIVEVLFGGRPIDPDAWYTVATFDFLANGGDGYSMFANAERLLSDEAGELVTAIVIRAIEAAGEIAPELEGRITVLN